MGSSGMLHGYSRHFGCTVALLVLFFSCVSWGHSWLDQRTRCSLTYNNDVKGDASHPCGFYNTYNVTNYHTAVASKTVSLTWGKLGHTGGIVSIRMAPLPGAAQNYTPTYSEFLANPLKDEYFDEADVIVTIPGDKAGPYVVEWQWDDFYSCADYHITGVTTPTPASGPASPLPSSAPPLTSVPGVLEGPVVVALLFTALGLSCFGMCGCGIFIARRSQRGKEAAGPEVGRDRTKSFWESIRRPLVSWRASRTNAIYEKKAPVGRDLTPSSVTLSETTSERGLVDKSAVPYVRYEQTPPRAPARDASHKRAERFHTEESEPDGEPGGSPRAQAKHYVQKWRRHYAENRRIVIGLGILLFLYIVTTVLASSLVIKWIVFSGDYLSPYKTLAPIVDDLNNYTKKEAEHYPNTTALAETCGHCNTSVYLTLVNETWRLSRAAVYDAIEQVIRRGCDLGHPSGAFCSSFYAGTLDILNNGEVPRPTFRAPTSDEVLHSFSSRVHDRYEYDKNYIRQKLGITTSFTLNNQFEFKAGKLSALNIHNDATFDFNDPAFLSIVTGLGTLGISTAYLDNMRLALIRVKIQSADLSAKLAGLEGLNNQFLGTIPTLNLGMTTDYNPPAVFDRQLNASLNHLTAPSGPAISTDAQVQQYSAGKLEMPSFLPNVGFPPIGMVLDILVGLDTALLFLDMLAFFFRLRFRRNKAFEIKHTFGYRMSKAVGRLSKVAGLRAKMRRAFKTAIGSLRPKHLYMLIGLMLYVLLLYVYVQTISLPLQDKNSYVYGENYFSYTNDLYDYNIKTKYNNELTSIANQCIGEKSVLANDLSTLRQEYKFNVSSLGGWAEDFWTNDPDYELKGLLFNTTQFDSVFGETKADELCNCTVLTYSAMYEDQRSKLALTADSQIYRIINSYVIKAHIFIGTLVLLRIARTMIVISFILLLSFLMTPRLEATVSLPANAYASIVPHAEEDEQEQGNILNYSVALIRFKKGRKRRLVVQAVLMFLFYATAIALLAWDAGVGQGLIFNAQ